MQPSVFAHPRFADHALLDSGDAAKLERFGDVTLVRPDPQALWPRRLAPEEWDAADLVFVRESDRGGRWERGRRASRGGRQVRPEDTWTISYRDARLLVRPTPFKHVGVFPEQAANWELILASGRELAGGGRPRLLNLFGYTGAASILAARAGYDVTHVDASKASLAWLRENVEATGIAGDAIRVVLEDATSFVRREVRRGRRYSGILLDPPHYGRGPKGEKWSFEAGIAPLLADCAALVDERAFVVLSSYAIGTSPLAMANVMACFEGGEVSAGELALPELEHPGTQSARSLPCGFCARWCRGLGLSDPS